MSDASPNSGPARPASHRRRPGRLLRAVHGLGALLLILVTLAAGREIIESRPGDDTVLGYFLRTGSVGDRVETLDYSATVLAVRGGRAIVTNLSGDELHTNGVWLLIRVQIEAHEEPQLLSTAVIYDRRGRTFDATQRFVQPLQGHWLQPAMPVEAELVFEVPRDAVPGAHLRLHNGSLADHNYQTVADIDLALTETAMESWVTSAEPLRVADTEVRL